MVLETSEHSYKDHVTNLKFRSRMQDAIGLDGDLNMVMKRKSSWYGNISRFSAMARQFCMAQ